MPEYVDVQPEALYDGDTGTPILTREKAQRDHAEWTAAHPPVPGLRWTISYDISGNVRDRSLEVIPGWEDAYAPARPSAPANASRPADSIPADESNRLGALAYRGWFAALPDVVRESGITTWGDLPEPFRRPMRLAAIIVWQHAENAGFHEALLRTLPSAQLGAAGEIENLADLLAAQGKLYGGPMPLSQVLAEMNRRVHELRRQADTGTDNVRKHTRHQ